MELKNRTLSNFAELVESGECKKFRGRLKVGVDLGTANTVLAVVDTNNRWKRDLVLNCLMPLLRSLREFPKAASKASDMYLKVPGLKSPTL